MNEEEIIKQVEIYIDLLLQERKFGKVSIEQIRFQEVLQGLLDLYQNEKEKNKQLEKQLQDIYDNFNKFNWQESNAKQIYNQLAELYESIYRK